MINSHKVAGIHDNIYVGTTAEDSMSISSKVIDMMDGITRDFALLIDLGPLQFSAKSSYKSLEALMSICFFGFTNLHCISIIALSSGANVLHNIPKECDSLYKFLVSLGKYQQCRFRPFTKEEADMYLSRNCLTLDLNLVFELTHYNPWLLSNLPQGNININETIGIIKLQMLKYIRNLLDSFKAIPLNNWVSSNLEETDRWLYKATNGVHLNQNDLNLFHLSWVCAECICDLQVTENKNYTVVCNFPYVHKLLLMELSTLKKSNKIPSNPIINGFIFEADFLRGVHNLRFIETLSDGKKFTFDIQYLYSLGIDEKLTNMETGVLYHLRHKHPVIDAVGILKRQDKKKYHLVFIQVSMSKYSSHSSKIEDLYRMIGCKELKTSSFASIFDFYMSMTAALVKMRKAFYIYVSPFEVGPEASNQLIGYIYPDLKIGVMPKLSETESLVSRIVSQFS